MAKCKDCATDIGFLKKRCQACETIFKRAEAVRHAQEREAADEAERVAGIRREDSSLMSARAGLSITHDKFEDKSSIDSPSFQSGHGAATMRFSCVNGKFYWLVASHKAPDWMWLNNNRTILLFPDGSRTIQDHDSLRATDVSTDVWDQVQCYEELHVDVTAAVPFFTELYEENRYEGPNPYVEMRIGPYEYSIPFDQVRQVMAMSQVAEEMH
jgi:hypothetical protein